MPITLSLMIVILLTSISAFINPFIHLKLMLHPYSVVHLKEVYRIVTADLVHNDPIHLLINEVVIYFACGSLEIYLRHHYTGGSLFCLAIYLMSTIFGSMVIIIQHFKNYDYSSSGASGSAIGTMFGYMILQPHVIAFYLPVIGGVQNIYGALCFIVGFVVYQFKSKNPMINNELHLYSAVGGVLATLILFHHTLLAI